MNDPGLDGPIANDADAIEARKRREEDNDPEEEEEREAEESYLSPSRWWFASTAFPLLAGTFGPMASAFSICALVKNWRVEIPLGGTEEHGIDIKDPKWLLALNALSLIFALVANFALLLNMARRIPFAVAQPITIIGWYIASFLLLALVCYASSSHFREPSINQALTGAFYYAIMAAVIYFLVSSLMCMTVWGAMKGHYSMKFELTMSQRTLMLQTISFMVYLLAGAAVFAHVEGWQFLDAVYWADFTLLTVGIGDYSPATHTGRALLFPFAIGGIVILGLVVGSIRSLVLERGKHKMGARMTEKTRRVVLKRLKKSEEGRAKLRPHSQESGSSIDELQRRKEEFDTMREIQHKASVKRKWMSLGISGSAWFILWFIGAIVLWKSETNQKWSYFESLYFCYTSLLTIGYGDLYPMSNSGKPFFVFWSLLAVPTLTILISNMGDTIVKGIRDVTLYLGELTVLPGEDGVRNKVRFGLRKLTGGHVRPGHDKISEEPLGLVTEPRSSIDDRDRERDAEANNEVTNTLASVLAQEEHEGETNAHERGDLTAEDKHHYRYLIIQEIQKVYNDLNTDPDKTYSYKEWTRFLALMGEDEAHPKYHKAPQVGSDTDQLSEARGFGQGQMGAPEKNHKQWSWIGDRSPLLGEKGEPRWLLEALCKLLESELKEERDAAKQQRRRSDGTAAESKSSSSGVEKSQVSR